MKLELTLNVSAELEEDGVRISLTVVDTPGFGDQIDNEFTCVSLSLVDMMKNDS